MLEVSILAQPDDTTCGPTALQAVYAFFGDDVPLGRIIDDVRSLDEGGTLAVFLGLDALRRGYRATLFSYNLREFDPTWKDLSRRDLKRKLREQLRYKTGKKFTAVSQAYIRFLSRGGEIRFDALGVALVRSFLDRRLPVLCGLSATYLYDCARERAHPKRRDRWLSDDVRGEPSGHFVIIRGIGPRGQTAYIADPYRRNPISGDTAYTVPVDRLLGAIFLGVVTYDANLLVIEPPGGAPGAGGR
jgi:hypothetical protein